MGAFERANFSAVIVLGFIDGVGGIDDHPSAALRLTGGDFPNPPFSGPPKQAGS